MARTIPVRNPRTGEYDYELQAVEPAELTAIAARLRAAQPGWQALGGAGRAEVMTRWAEAVTADAPRIIDALIADTGRYTISRNEVNSISKKIARLCAQAPGWLETSEETSKVAPNVAFRAQYVPFQLAGMISPWNFPVTLSLIDALPALMAGCAVILKPSEITPRFIEPLRDTIQAVPELAAIFEIVGGDGALGAAVVETVDMICFTGSVPTGRKVAESAGRRFIPAFLELGGKDPAIVLAGADIDSAADAILRQSVVNSGQVCLSLERVYVERPIFEPFLKTLVAKAQAVSLNDQDIRSGHLGPIISEAQITILKAHLDEAVAGGAQVHCGGTFEGKGGAWLRPTVVTGVTHAMRIVGEESFGPLIPVMAFDDAEEAVALANDTEFGLSAAVFAADDAAALAIAERIDAGGVSINDAGIQSLTTEAEKMSFKASGLGGSRMGRAGFMRFFRKKALMIQRGQVRTVEQFREQPEAAHHD
jgi:succinate-semialdehyde dehydrogenase/glutarate-semialdehyde dehydrogenase